MTVEMGWSSAVALFLFSALTMVRSASLSILLPIFSLLPGWIACSLKNENGGVLRNSVCLKERGFFTVCFQARDGMGWDGPLCQGPVNL